MKAEPYKLNFKTTKIFKLFGKYLKNISLHKKLIEMEISLKEILFQLLKTFNEKISSFERKKKSLSDWLPF